MSHCVTFRSYPCKKTEGGILRDLNHWAFDPQETSRYHGDMRFFKDKLFDNYEDAKKRLEDHYDNHNYQDACVRYKDGRKIFWLAKIEYHC